jgi:FAD/FMN-containing dehydrogenase
VPLGLADRLAAVVGADAVSVDPAVRRAASRDYSWLSPVLAARLPATVADVVVSPAGTEGVARVLALAYEAGVPVTPRGRGTGNYGQAVPLAGGIVLDAERRGRVLEVGEGWVRAEAGVSFTRLEAAARATGQELAMFPSTVSSSLGGFLAGGAGGSGSIAHGFLWEGFVLAAEVLGCWDHPEPVSVEGADTLPFLHAYGTTGVVTEAVVRLVPARRWTALWAALPTYRAAVAAGRAIAALDPAPRNLCIDDPGLVACFPPSAGLDPDRFSLRAVLAADEPNVTAAARAAVTGEGGEVLSDGPDDMGLLVSLSFNHVTLRAKRRWPDACHVQVGGPALVERHEEARALLPGGLLHHDAMAPGGVPQLGGLLIGRYPGPDALAAAMDGLRALGVFVTDPHTWRLGQHGGLAPLRAAAARFDPAGLLNPGKLPAPGE